MAQGDRSERQLFIEENHAHSRGEHVAAARTERDERGGRYRHEDGGEEEGNQERGEPKSKKRGRDKREQRKIVLQAVIVVTLVPRLC